jgi:NCS1 nucleoside transporter family
LLFSLLADQPGRHSDGNRIHPDSARDQRARVARGWFAALGVGLSPGGRLRSYVGRAFAFRNFADFLKFLIPALNGTVGFWATVSLNIPDFTRFARNQREQIIGQALALPTTMTLYAFIGIAVTSATVVIYGTAISDPVQLLSRFHSPVAVVISLIAILLATLNVNIGANVVSPANDFSNLWPRKISFRTGGVITCFMGVALMPWKLLADYNTFILGWLGGYAAFLGPVAGIMICDYFVFAGVFCKWMISIFVAESTNIQKDSTGAR